MINTNLCKLPFFRQFKDETYLMQKLSGRAYFLYTRLKECGSLDWYTGIFDYQDYVSMANYINDIQEVGTHRIEKIVYNRRSVKTNLIEMVEAGLIEFVERGKIRFLKIELFKPFKAQQNSLERVENKKAPAQPYKNKKKSDTAAEGVVKRKYDANLVL